MDLEVAPRLFCHKYCWPSKVFSRTVSSLYQLYFCNNVTVNEKAIESIIACSYRMVSLLCIVLPMICLIAINFILWNFQYCKTLSFW